MSETMTMSAKLSHLRRMLSEVGFTDVDARVYLALLALREAPCAQIAKKAQVKRPTTYLALETLQENGFASSVVKGRGRVYRALSPWVLVEDLHAKYERARSALPDLESLAAAASRPEMTVYEGKEGIRHVIEDSLNAEGEILSWANISLATTTILKELYPRYIEKRVAKGIRNREIAGFDKLALEYKKKDKEHLRELRLIPKEKFPFSNKINIYNDRISIVAHNDAVGVVIENKDIVDTQRSIFNLAFEYAGILEKQLLERTAH